MLSVRQMHVHTPTYTHASFILWNSMNLNLCKFFIKHLFLLCPGLIHANHGLKISEYLVQQLKGTSNEVREVRRERERERERERQTDRQTDRQRQRDRQTDRESNEVREIRRERQREREGRRGRENLDDTRIPLGIVLFITRVT